MRRLVQTICLMVSILSMSCVSQSKNSVVAATPQKSATAGAKVATNSTAVRAKAPRVGDKAPLFSLKTFDNKTKVESLAKLVANKPTVLFFGSYT